jgi:hypothetical protein
VRDVTRAVVAGVVAVSIVLTGCAGHRSASHPSQPRPACPLLAQLARTGLTVAHADVSDPDAFEMTLRAAVASYLRTAQRLQAAVPAHLRADVEHMIVAIRTDHFSDAEGARADIDDYERSTCRST